MFDHQFATFPYNPLNKQYRMLWHQGLDTVLRYPALPRKTMNFDGYPIFKSKVNRQVSLGGTIATISERFIEDAKIVELWLADDLSMLTGFFYELFRFLNAPLETDENLVWFPKDRTDKAFVIQILDLAVSNSDEMSVNPVNSIGKRDWRWLRDEVKFEFQVVRPFAVPNVVAFLEGV